MDAAPRKQLTRKEFPADALLQVGAEFDAGIPGGQRIKLVVHEISGDVVTVRLVHPLAGQTVSMSVKVLGVREATAAELQSGKALVKPPPPPPGA